MAAVPALTRPEVQDWYSEVPRSIRGHSMAGLFLVLAAFGGFGFWAATAPLASAVVSQGTFVATGANKIIQHLEGGIIKEIMVAEGQTVKEGDVLVSLDQTAALANERALKLRLLRLETIVARLRAQASGERDFKVPAVVLAEASDPDVAALIKSQNFLFQKKKIKLEEQLNLIGKNISSLEFRAQGYQGQKRAFDRQLVLLTEERDTKKGLVAQGYLRKTEQLALDRAVADASGQISRLEGEANESLAQIQRYRQEAVIAVDSSKQEALDALEAAESDLGGVREQSREAVGVLNRTVIRSPVSGTVVRLYYHTPGGVITTGKPIMEILPVGVPLIIEAQVPRASIDQLHEGQLAAIRLSSLNHRTTPVIDGTVYYISADSVEEGTFAASKDVYIVRVKVPESEIARVPHFRPVPGMPADVMIQTSERTFLDYLTRPVVDSMSRAFREK
ncbi:MAG TPA: HlyD family type I secretion periplasmic adaptor subunit [Ensifer sp.]|nr:HlyD family type I secretion periplasmic adaptor subunit [Ensifer sp.]